MNNTEQLRQLMILYANVIFISPNKGREMLKKRIRQNDLT